MNIKAKQWIGKWRLNRLIKQIKVFICVKANKIRKCLAGLIKQQKKSSQNVMNERQHKILERMILK